MTPEQRRIHIHRLRNFGDTLVPIELMKSKVAKILRGKYKTNFTPHADCGDNVVIVNASKIVMSGNKMDSREIFSHTGFPGGQKRITPRKMLEKDGTSVVRHAIKALIALSRSSLL